MGFNSAFKGLIRNKELQIIPEGLHKPDFPVVKNYLKTDTLHLH
jgi:hypothetical protein